MKKIFVLFYFFAAGFSALAQTDTCHLRISLLTCSPGEELYATFGHSALRVVDSSHQADIIFNYGTFDFDDPDFYKKFIRGKLLYFVSVDTFTDFIQEYQYEQRGITEQVLNLSCTEKQNLLAALFENAKEENKYYKYDFVLDNCTTRLRDMVAKYCKDSLISKNILPYKGVTFRNLIHEYLDKGKEYWSKLGIDILLGSPLDKRISNKEAMFLPDYLLKGFDSTSIGERKLVANKITILASAHAVSKRKLFTPLPVSIFLFLVITITGFIRTGRLKSFLRIFDFIFFFLCGALGMLLLFMWFGTDHLACRNNFNLLWALPTHFIAAFFIHKKWKLLKYYFLGNAILSSFILIFWNWLPQELNIALAPVVALLFLRSIIRYKKLQTLTGETISRSEKSVYS